MLKLELKMISLVLFCYISSWVTNLDLADPDAVLSELLTSTIIAFGLSIVVDFVEKNGHIFIRIPRYILWTARRRDLACHWPSSTRRMFLEPGEELHDMNHLWGTAAVIAESDQYAMISQKY